MIFCTFWSSLLSSFARQYHMPFCSQSRPLLVSFRMVFSRWEYDDLRGPSISFLTFFVWTLLLIIHTWNSSPLRSNLLRLQCTCFTVRKKYGRPHGSPHVWTCQWPSSQPLSSPLLSHSDMLWALGITKSYREQALNYTEGEELSWCPSWSNSL